MTRALPKQSVAKGVEYERVPKGEPVSPKAQEWEGWGTALKPAWEPICVARKPLDGTVVQNVLKHGTGGLNIGASLVGDESRTMVLRDIDRMHGGSFGAQEGESTGQAVATKTYNGRWPANIAHDGSDEVRHFFPGTAEESTARFFFSAKASDDDRIASEHPTVKRLDLMQWLVRLVTPKGGTVLDLFAGTGTTGEAAWREGFNAVLIERDPTYQADIARRMDLALNPTKRAAVVKTGNNIGAPIEALPLFGGVETPATPPPLGTQGLQRVRHGRTIGPTGLKR